MSETAVRSHVSHLYAKIGERDRAQAVAYAYRNGLAADARMPSVRRAGRVLPNSPQRSLDHLVEQPCIMGRLVRAGERGGVVQEIAGIFTGAWRVLHACSRGNGRALATWRQAIDRRVYV